MNVFQWFNDVFLKMTWLKESMAWLVDNFLAGPVEPYRSKLTIFPIRYYKDFRFAFRTYFRYLLYSKLFPAGADETDIGALQRYHSEYLFRSAWNSDTILFLFVDPAVHRLYGGGSAAGDDVFFSDFFSLGRFGLSDPVSQHFQLADRFGLCCGRADTSRGGGRDHRQGQHGR